MPAEWIDSHVHVWETAQVLYPPPAALQQLPGAGPTVDLLRETMHAHGVGRAVLVQPSNYEFDNRYLAASLAREPGRFAGVARIDPVDAAAPARLVLWVEQYGVRGLRIAPFGVLAGEWVLDALVAPLWERAAQWQVPVCFQGGRGWLGRLAEMLDTLAGRFPSLRLALDHMGHPEVEHGLAHPDLRRMLALARHPNIRVKISGHYALSHEPYPYRDMWPFMRAIYDQFGPQRMLWGSDFPYVLLHEGYARAVALVAGELPFLNDADRAWIMGRATAEWWAFQG